MMKSGGVIIVGMLLGLAGGLIYTWFIAPVQYYDTYPPMLAPRHRQEWIAMTAWTYGLEGNWERTQARLLELPESEIREGTIKILEEAVVAGQTTEALQRIARLAAAHGATGPGVAIYTGTILAPLEAVAGADPEATPTVLPLPTATAVELLLPSPTPTTPPPATATSIPVQISPFSIVSQTLTCELEPRIAVSLEVSRTVSVQGRERSEIIGLPGRELWLLWDSGADRAITGFRPATGLGYADFGVEPGHRYNLYIDAPIGLPLLTIMIEPCEANEGGWISRFLTVREAEDPEETELIEETPSATRPAITTATATPRATAPITTATATPTATAPNTTSTVTPTATPTTSLAPVPAE